MMEWGGGYRRIGACMLHVKGVCVVFDQVQFSDSETAKAWDRQICMQVGNGKEEKAIECDENEN